MSILSVKYSKNFIFRRQFMVTYNSSASQNQQPPNADAPNQIPGQKPEKKGMSGCMIALIVCLVLMFTVIPMIAIIAAIAIPGILSARRAANENAALGNMKSASTMLAVMQNKSNDMTYPIAIDKTPDLSADPFYQFNKFRGGYHFEYYVSNEKIQYVMIAYPEQMADGGKIFVTDESNSIWEARSENYPVSFNVSTDYKNVWAKKNGPDRIDISNTSPWIKKY